MIEAAQPEIREYAHGNCRTSNDVVDTVNEVVDTVPITNEGLGRAFRTALLLTASAERAEAAILEGVRAMGASEVSDESLLREVMTASIASKIHEERVEEAERDSSWLPSALRRVLRLSRNLRHCFVLRVLAGLPREVCALMLQTGPQQIDELVCDSVQALAVFSRSEQPTRVSADIMPARN